MESERRGDTPGRRGHVVYKVKLWEDAVLVLDVLRTGYQISQCCSASAADSDQTW